MKPSGSVDSTNTYGDVVFMLSVGLHLKDSAFQFLYVEDDRLIFSNPETYELLEVRKSLVNRAVIPFLESKHLGIYLG